MTFTVTQEARGHLPGDGVRLAYAYWPGVGPPIVAIHGASANALFYVGVADRLAGRRPLLSLDLRGRGNADKPDGPYGMRQHARDAARAIEAWGIPRAVIVGHSMGAYVALALARQRPELCAGIVVYDGGRLALEDVQTNPVAVKQFLEAARPIEIRMGTTFASRPEYDDFWRGLCVFDREQWGPWVEAYLDYDLAAGDDGLRPRCAAHALAADVQDLLAAAKGEPPGPVDVPVLALCADNGLVTGTLPLITDEGLDDLARQCRSFSHERLSGTNHYTIALAEPAATIVADRLVAFATSCV